MKALLFSIFCYFGVIFICHAQIDSILPQNNNLRNLFWAEFNKNPSIAKQLPMADFTETSLYTTIKNQPLSKTQNPNKVSYYGFNSNGIFTLKNEFKLFGNLDFSRSYSSETSYTLFHNLTEEFNNELLPNTNYPLVIRSGDNENLHYKLKGGITGNIFKNVPFSATIVYNLDKFFGLNIPKTEQETIQYNGTFQIGYQFKNHTLFPFLSLEKKQTNFNYNTVSINNTPIDQISSPNTYVGYSVGYGDVLGFNIALLAGLTENNTHQLGIGYNFNFKNHFFTLKYTHKENTARYYSTVYRDENNLASLFERSFNMVDFSYINNYQSKFIIINGNFTTGEAYNTHAFENYIENATSRTVKSNYQHILNQGDISVTWQKRKNNRTYWSFNFSSKIAENRIEDYNTTQKYVLSNYSNISINKDFPISKNSFLNLETGFNYYTPITSSLAYEFQNSSTSTGGSLIPPSNTFGEAVIMHDFDFDTLQKLGSIFNLQYQHNLQKNKSFIVVLNYSFLTGLASSSNTKNNNTFGASLKFQY